MAHKLGLIHANVDWLLEFAYSRYVLGVHVPLPGNSAQSFTEDKKPQPMEIDTSDSLLVQTLKRLFPEYSLPSNFDQAYEVAQTHLNPLELQRVSADPEMLKMLVSALLS